MVREPVGQVIEQGLCYDRLDLSNLACMEVASRLYQMVEDTMEIEGADYHMGKQDGARSGRAVAPVPSKHATEKLARDTEIIKQQRKAREGYSPNKTPAAKAKAGGDKKK